MPRVQAPDGTQIDFPDSMKDPDIEAAMGRLFPSTPGARPAGPKAGLTGRDKSDPANPASPYHKSGTGQAADAMEAFGEMAAPAALATGAFAPAAAIGAGIAGYGGDYLGRKLAEQFGASPDTSRLAGHLASLPIGALGGAAAESPAIQGGVRGAISALPSAVKDASLPAGIGYMARGTHLGPVADAAAAIRAVPPVARGFANGARDLPSFGPAVSAFRDSVSPALPQRLMIAGPEDGSFVRSGNAQYGEQPSLSAAPSVRMGNAPSDSSYVRSTPAMNQPPNSARALPAAQPPIVTPAPADASYVRAEPAEYATPSTASGVMDQAQSGSDALAKIPAQAGQVQSGSPAPEITKQYQPSRTKARFDKSGKRIGG